MNEQDKTQDAEVIQVPASGYVLDYYALDVGCVLDRGLAAKPSAEQSKEASKCST